MTQEEKREELENKLRISQSHLDQSEEQVDRLTQQTKELQEVIDTLQEAQDFTVRILRRRVVQSPFASEEDTLFFLSFCGKHRRPSRDLFVSLKLSNFPGHVCEEDINPQLSDQKIEW